VVLYQLIQARAKQDPNAIALAAPGRTPMTYAALQRNVAALARRLRRCGATSATPVATLLPNGVESAVTFLGVASASPCMPLNPASPAEEMRFHLEDSGAQFVVADEALDSGIRVMLRDLRLTLLAVGDDPELPSERQVSKDAGSPARDPMASDIALILHTSGTTATPKLVPLTHANLLASAQHIADGLLLGAADRCLNVMPLFHIHGLVGVLLASICGGSSVVCTRGFNADAFIDWVQEFQPTWYSAVPTIHQVVASIAGRYRSRLPQHRFRFIRSSSAALPPAAMRELEAATGAPVIEAYGMTEASHQMASNPLPPGLRKPGSVGRPAGAEVSIVDGDGRPLGVDQVGEVVVRGPGVMSGYGGGAPANGAAFIGGWFRTGDLGRVDRDGYLFITGRLKEIVNRGGNKVSPREVDEALLGHCEVAQAAAFSVFHPSLGEDLVAAVVLKHGSTLGEPALREFLFRRIAAYKIPSRIVLVGEIPKGATGKVQRHTLAERLAPQLEPSFLAATTDTEYSLAMILRLVLGTAVVDVHANFFALGGDSLKGMQAVNMINNEHGTDLAATALFHHPTIAQLAPVVASAKAAESERQAVVAREVASMSDAEVERLLAEEEAALGKPSDQLRS
jgi:acyl-CoA synthetase (AMP-forming)/AMP-acid ligase II